MSKKIKDHFKRVDPILYEAVLKINDDSIFTLTRSQDYFISLCEIITNQQLSGKAADTIFTRFKNLFPKKKILPLATLKLEDEKMRKAGFSRSKVKFIKNLAQQIVSKKIDLNKVARLDIEAIKKNLLVLNGIGPWTVEMFLIFSLGKEDVFSIGDLGLRKGVKKLYRFKKTPTPMQIERIAKKWSPYKSYACRILWRSLELP